MQRQKNACAKLTGVLYLCTSKKNKEFRMRVKITEKNEVEIVSDWEFSYSYFEGIKYDLKESVEKWNKRFLGRSFAEIIN